MESTADHVTADFKLKVMYGPAAVQTLAFKHRQLMFEWALPMNMYDYTLPFNRSVSCSLLLHVCDEAGLVPSA